MFCNSYWKYKWKNIYLVQYSNNNKFYNVVVLLVQSSAHLAGSSVTVWRDVYRHVLRPSGETSHFVKLLCQDRSSVNVWWDLYRYVLRPSGETSHFVKLLCQDQPLNLYTVQNYTCVLYTIIKVCKYLNG